MIELDEKKTEQLNIRVSPELKQALREEAAKLDWPATKLAEKILRKWLEDAKTNNIGIKQFISY